MQLLAKYPMVNLVKVGNSKYVVIPADTVKNIDLENPKKRYYITIEELGLLCSFSRFNLVFA